MDAVGDVLAFRERSNAAARRLMAQVAPEDLAKSTPCAEWDVRALINHLVLLSRSAAASITGGEQPDWSTDQLGDDPGQAFEAALEAAESAFRQPGVLDRTLVMPWGEWTGRELASMGAMDSVIHTWDLARATGHPAGLDADLCETVLALGQQMMTPEFRTPEMGFGPELPVPAAAPACDRLAGFFGRRP